jgi:hypothetical protein
VMMTDAEKAATEVILGVDTHLDVHVAVALDHLGRRLGELSVPTKAKGYESLVCWAEGFGTVRCAGVEGTSSYGARITRYLRTAAIPVSEVERPKRRHSHRSSKSDSRDAESAARAVLARWVNKSIRKGRSSAKTPALRLADHKYAAQSSLGLLPQTSREVPKCTGKPRCLDALVGLINRQTHLRLRYYGVNIPPSRSQSDCEGRQALPSQALWYIALSRPRPKTSSRFGPQATAGPLERDGILISSFSRKEVFISKAAS